MGGQLRNKISLSYSLSVCVSYFLSLCLSLYLSNVVLGIGEWRYIQSTMLAVAISNGTDRLNIDGSAHQLILLFASSIPLFGA